MPSSARPVVGAIESGGQEMVSLSSTPGGGESRGEEGLNSETPLSGSLPTRSSWGERVATPCVGGLTATFNRTCQLFGLEWALGGGGRQPLLVLDGAPGTSFRLEHSWNLSPTNWSLLSPVTLGGSRFYYVDTFDTNRFMRFYRAVPE